MGRDSLGIAKNINLIVGTALVIISVFNIINLFTATTDPMQYILDIYQG
jgi:hypothetical protein